MKKAPTYDAPFPRRRQIWLGQVAADKRQDQTSLRVAMVLSGYFNPTQGDEAWPSQETLASSVGTQRQNVQAALKHLVESGHVATRKVGRGMRYRMLSKHQHASGQMQVESASGGMQVGAQYASSQMSHTHSAGCTNREDQGEGPSAPSPNDTLDSGYARDAYPFDQESSRVRPAAGEGQGVLAAVELLLAHIGAMRAGTTDADVWYAAWAQVNIDAAEDQLRQMLTQMRLPQFYDHATIALAQSRIERALGGRSIN